jgi:hypothetical protein
VRALHPASRNEHLGLQLTCRARSYRLTLATQALAPARGPVCTPDAISASSTTRRHRSSWRTIHPTLRAHQASLPVGTHAQLSGTVALDGRDKGELAVRKEGTLVRLQLAHTSPFLKMQPTCRDGAKGWRGLPCSTRLPNPSGCDMSLHLMEPDAQYAAFQRDDDQLASALLRKRHGLVSCSKKEHGHSHKAACQGRQIQVACQPRAVDGGLRLATDAQQLAHVSHWRGAATPPAPRRLEGVVHSPGGGVRAATDRCTTSFSSAAGRQPGRPRSRRRRPFVTSTSSAMARR